MAEVSIKRDPRKDLEFLNQLYQNTGGNPEYDRQEQMIFDAYGGEEQFVNAAKLSKNAENKQVVQEETVTEEPASSNVSTTGGDVTMGNALGGEVNTLLNQQGIIEDIENKLNSDDQKRSEIDFIAETAGLNDSQKNAMLTAFGLNNKNLFERITENVGALFTGREEFGIDPQTLDYAFARTSPAEEIKARLKDPRVGIGLNIIEQAGTPGFASPIARIAKGVNEYNKSAQEADLAKLRYGTKTDPNKESFSYSKGIKYTIGDIRDPKNPDKDLFFPDQEIGVIGIASGVVGSQTGIKDLQTFVKEDEVVTDTSGEDDIKIKDEYGILKDKSDEVTTRYKSQLEPAFLESEQLIPTIESQIAAIRNDSSAFQEYGPKTKVFANFSNFLKAIAPSREFYEKFFEPVTKLGYDELSQLKFEDKISTKKVLTQSKKLYPVSNADINLLADSFANYGDSPEIYLRTVSFQHGLGTYANLLQRGYQEFLDINKDPKLKYGSTGYASSLYPDSQAIINGKKYTDAVSYARAYANDYIKNNFGDVDPGQYGYSKNKISDYGKKTGVGLAEDDYSPIAYLASNYYKQNEDLLSGLTGGGGPDNNLIFKNDKPQPIFFEEVDGVLELDRDKTDNDVEKFIIKMSQDAIKLSKTDGGKALFEEKYPGYSFPFGEGAVMLEEQYQNYYNSYGN
jgi:hypothetical protein